MTPQEFQKFYPLIAQWLRETLAAHARSARAVASCGFLGLPLYFKAETLSLAKVVVLDRLPMPPLSSWGLTQFADFERGDPDGVAYLDTFFLKPHQSKNEVIHFHELIQLQWRVLGPEQFLRTYADGLESFGYRDSPLEVMAYNAEARFASSIAPFDAERLVVENLARGSPTSSVVSSVRRLLAQSSRSSEQFLSALKTKCVGSDAMIKGRSLRDWMT